MGFQKFGATRILPCNMRITLFLSLIVFLLSSAFSCEIPFNNKTGIPFSMQFEAPYVASFEVDAKGDFYFSGADSIVRKISGVNQKVLFTKHVKGLQDGQLGFIGETLWMVSRSGKSTVRLTSLDPKSGEIKSDTLLSFDRSLGLANGGYILDQKIIFSFAAQPPTLNYVKIDPISKKYQMIKNQNDIDLGPDSLSYKLPEYLGRWDSLMVFSAPSMGAPNKKGPDSTRVALIDKTGSVVGKKEISFEGSEDLFPSTAVSLVRMSVGKIYFLRKMRKQKKAVIFTMDLQSISTSAPTSKAP